MQTVPEALQLAHDAARAGDFSRARFVYEQILRAVPDEPNALIGVGMLLLREGRLEAAESHLRRALAQGFDSPELRNNLGIALKAAGSLEAAAAEFRQAIRLRPDYSDAHYNLANTLVMLHQLPEAEQAFAVAARLNPSDCDIHNNWGALLRLRGRLGEAAKCFEAALAIRADSAEAHRNRASLRLLLGDYEHGWPEYEWRWKINDAPRPTFSEPLWQGQPLEGSTILLWAEQGLGDTIQFIRYAPLVKQRGARVLVDCPPSLHALLHSAAGIDRFVVADGARFDYYVPLLSLPAVLGTTLATVPAEVPYLRATSERTERWKKELAAVKAFKVGIAWQGSTRFPGDYFRSLPLACFAPVAACPGVQLFSLQKGTGSEQLASWAGPGGIVDLGASLDLEGDAFVDTAAVMMNLDLVITSDTSMAHLAGALGVPVWVALQETPNWRWLMGRDDSPWYPTMRLFRQSSLGDWDGVFAEMAARLRSLSARGSLE